MTESPANTNIWNQPLKPLCVQINRRSVAMAVVSLLIKPDRHWFAFMWRPEHNEECRDNDGTDWNALYTAGRLTYPRRDEAASDVRWDRMNYQKEFLSVAS